MNRLKCVLWLVLVLFLACGLSYAIDDEMPDDVEIQDEVISVDSQVLKRSPTIVIVNKATSKRHVFDVRQGSSASFEDIKLALDSCQTTESGYVASVKIFDTRVQKNVFIGQLYSPQLSKKIFEHDVYSITLLHCS